MKKITLWLFALFTCWQISAQTGTVVIGVDDGTPNTASGDPSPLQDYYKTQRIQILYTAAELTGAGLVAGDITEIGWVATALNTSTLQEGYTISMKNTVSTVLTATFESGATVVYGPTDFTPSSTGNVMFPLTTPFSWDGTSNVIVEVCAGLASGAWSENVSCANSTTAGIQTVYYRNDTATAPCSQATGTTTTTKPVVVITGAVASCLPPTGLTIGTVTAFTAEASWDPGSVTSYEYVISTSATPPASGTNTTNTFCTVGSLAPQTLHYLHVRSVCAGPTYSGWATTSFTTACVPVATLPWSENFDALTPGTNVFPTCWAYTNTLSTWSISTTPVAHSGANSLRRTWNTDGWAFTPVVTLTGGTSYRFSYYVRTDNATVGYDITVGVGNGQNSAAMTNLSTVTGYQGASWVKVNHEFTPTVTGDYSFGLHVVAPFAPDGINFDDFTVELTPTCPDQTGLTVGNITDTSADFSWDDLSGNGAVGYEYAVTTSATPPASGTSTTATIYADTSLSPQTVYYLHVRSECSGSTYGNWGTISFVTACAPVTSFVQNFDAVTTPAMPTCWTKVGATGLANTQTASPNSAPNTLYIFGSSGTDTAVVTMQPVSNMGAGTHRIKFDMRANFTVGGVIEFGYLTNQTDASTFVSLTSFTASTLTYATYQFVPPAGAYSNYMAFKHTGVPSNSILIDNVIWELLPTCPDQTGLTVGNITSTSADFSWDNMSTNYEYAVTTSATPPASGTATTATIYADTSLSPQTLYYLHVRTDCGSGNYGLWTSISFTTQCAPITSLPWNEGFEGLTVVGTNNFPACWLKENGDWSSQNTNSAYSTANTGTHYIRDAWTAANEYIWTPGFDLVAGTSYDFSSFVQGDNGTGWVVDYFVNSTQNSTGATQIGASYNVPGTGTPYAFQAYAQVTRTFVPATSGTYYFAVRVNQPSSAPWYVSFDDFELKLSPSTPPTCASNLVATPNACGNFVNALNWDATPLANGYYVTIGTTSGGTDIANAVNVGANSYNFSGTVNTQYFWTVVPYNGSGSATGCSEQSFTTAATGCYCTSVPTSNDNLGITSAVVGATTNTIADVTYVDLTASPEIVAPGANTNVQLTFSTGFEYDINIWIDFNNDFDFDDAGELVKTGIACTDAQPNTVDASFTMPMSAPSGLHRMRIGTADDGQTIPTPCYSGAFGVTLDFTVDTTLGANSFDKSSFVAYPNPVKDILNLSYKTAISNVRVVNLLGQEVLNSNVNANDVQVNMSNLSAGAYIVNITADDVVHTIKVIKE